MQSQAPADETASGGTLQWIGLFLGPILCVICLYALPETFETVVSPAEFGEPAMESGAVQQVPPSLKTVTFSWAGRATLAAMVWMGVWWLTEALHISVTALLPMVLFPLLGIASIRDACFPFADPLVFLYFGGFVLAISMERWGLGKRIALHTLKIVGTSAPSMIAGFMLVTAVLSAFVSNTATTAMMLPIALSVIALVKPQTSPGQAEGRGGEHFGTCLLLAIAYSASVGGVMTIIGTPTNAFLVGFLRDKIATAYRQDISFVGWLPIGVPFAIVFLPIMFLMLTRVLFPIGKVAMQGGKALIDQELAELGKVRRGEWNTLCVFSFVILLWMLRPLLTDITVTVDSNTLKPLANLTDTGIAMLGAFLLFLVPVNVQKRIFTMDWKSAERMPWGILFLFGGGLSLAAAIQANGVAEFIGSQANQFGTLSPILLVLIVTTVIVFMTELTSNAATTASLVPVLAALAPGLGVHPYLLIVPATVAASCAFMLPVATPPNAIVFGSGAISVPQMVRAGFLLNLIAILLVTLLTMWFIRPWLGIP
ncbi:SLC13 family permease [Aureliella helgolandensis]|uniref:Sodium-dependent dicarboxylate transporter SdcS n=1 Tax=Aureliella helgolandensis TaxID=2527968 RepID=A0A518G5S1_9BACT|nr:SLC13 family permease [Aureliella helgolandensis]QDV23914.1 Sodium-dependent dicarboxylate transporter SdcS [Aureliella helgolandensis]